MLKKLTLRALMVALPLGGATTTFGNAITGPSSSESPYLVRAQPGVVTKSILTVGDAVNYKADGVTPYRLVGIPDGLGAFDNGDGTFTLLVNHELSSSDGVPLGVVRDHGFAGAFVSKWIIETETLTVLHGEDLIKEAFQWDVETESYEPLTTAMLRLCSADLPALSAFYNPATGLGYNGRIFMDGEEVGAEGRGFAHLLDGSSYELPWLGKFSWENSVAHPGTGDHTVVVGLDDAGGGQVYVYIGQKTDSADPIAAAGLRDGNLFGVKVTGSLTEPAGGIPSGTAFTLYDLGDVSAKTGAQLQTDSVAGSVTGFNRPEDGAWDPLNPNDFYFVTTASFTGPSRLWRLHFDDLSNLPAGGTLSMLLDGTEGQKMMDNITVNMRGEVIIQEDVGGNDHIGKVWRYNIASDTLDLLVQHDPDRFAPGASDFLTRDEESSGVIPAFDILGEGWYFMDVQAHYATDAELVEGGQLLAVHIPPGPKKK